MARIWFLIIGGPYRKISALTNVVVVAMGKDPKLLSELLKFEPDVLLKWCQGCVLYVLFTMKLQIPQCVTPEINEVPLKLFGNARTLVLRWTENRTGRWIPFSGLLMRQLHYIAVKRPKLGNQPNEVDTRFTVSILNSISHFDDRYSLTGTGIYYVQLNCNIPLTVG